MKGCLELIEKKSACCRRRFAFWNSRHPCTWHLATGVQSALLCKWVIPCSKAIFWPGSFVSWLDWQTDAKYLFANKLFANKLAQLVGASTHRERKLHFSRNLFSSKYATCLWEKSANRTFGNFRFWVYFSWMYVPCIYSKVTLTMLKVSGCHF